MSISILRLSWTVSVRPNVFRSAICTITFKFPMSALNSHGDVQKHYYQSILIALIPFILISIGLQCSILDVSEILPTLVTQNFNVRILPFKLVRTEK